jgi:hypothetical protein
MCMHKSPREKNVTSFEGIINLEDRYKHISRALPKPLLSFRFLQSFRKGHCTPQAPIIQPKPIRFTDSCTQCRLYCACYIVDLVILLLQMIYRKEFCSFRFLLPADMCDLAQPSTRTFRRTYETLQPERIEICCPGSCKRYNILVA